jgi:superfamily I DNA/RNA helicase
VSRLHKKDNDINCPARTITEDLLQEVVVRAINQALAEKDTFLPALKESVERALSNRNSARIAEIDAELEKQQKELLRNANAKKGFDSIADKIETLRDEKHRLRLEDANNDGAKSRIAELEMFLDGLSGQIEEYDEDYARRLIERITVDDDHFTVEFKSGLETVVEA